MTDIPPGADANAVLAGLPPDALRALAPYLRDEPLPLRRVLQEPGSPVDAVYFPLSGVVSIVAEVDGDDVIEVGTTGYEGMVGLSLYLGADAPTERALVQVSGQALSMAADDFLRCCDVVGQPLHAALHRYSHTLLTQLARNSACNRVHTVHQRAARWLLMTGDRMRASTFDLTQEFLAQMLAVRRATVNQVSRQLADDGCISYVRGTITIVDRDRLHAHACSCYDIIHATTSPTTRAA